MLETAIYSVMRELVETLRELEGEDRSERARRIAVTITEMEKVLAYYNTFVLEKQ